LLLGRHAYGIVGLADDESEALLQELMDFACQPPRIYYHQWEPGEAVLWDNRCLMHRATPWPMHEPRIMYHARIAGDKTSKFAAHAQEWEPALKIARLGSHCSLFDRNRDSQGFELFH
jgi:hypothetical protein